MVNDTIKVLVYLVCRGRVSRVSRGLKFRQFGHLFVWWLRILGQKPEVIPGGEGRTRV